MRRAYCQNGHSTRRPGLFRKDGEWYCRRCGVLVELRRRRTHPLARAIARQADQLLRSLRGLR